MTLEDKVATLIEYLILGILTSAILGVIFIGFHFFDLAIKSNSYSIFFQIGSISFTVGSILIVASSMFLQVENLSKTSDTLIGAGFWFFQAVVSFLYYFSLKITSFPTKYYTVYTQNLLDLINLYFNSGNAGIFFSSLLGISFGMLFLGIFSMEE